MERLTDSNKEIPALVDNAEYWLKVYFKLKDYEDLEEQGRLIKLPCKVGDTLYRLVPDLYRKYVEIKIAQFVINKNGIYFITNKGVHWSVNRIGKTVFLKKIRSRSKTERIERWRK